MTAAAAAAAVGAIASGLGVGAQVAVAAAAGVVTSAAPHPPSTGAKILTGPTIFPNHSAADAIADWPVSKPRSSACGERAEYCFESTVSEKRTH